MTGWIDYDHTGDTITSSVWIIDSTSFVASFDPAIDREMKRKTARESFRAFTNPDPGKGVDHYSHPAGRR